MIVNCQVPRLPTLQCGNTVASLVSGQPGTADRHLFTPGRIGPVHSLFLLRFHPVSQCRKEEGVDFFGMLRGVGLLATPCVSMYADVCLFVWPPQLGVK